MDMLEVQSSSSSRLDNVFVIDLGITIDEYGRLLENGLGTFAVLWLCVLSVECLQNDIRPLNAVLRKR